MLQPGVGDLAVSQGEFAESGEVLWKFQTGNGIFAPPTSFTIEGKQYIGLASGWNSIGDFLIRAPVARRGGTYFLFGLMED